MSNIVDPVILQTKFVRTRTCRPLVGKTVWKSSSGTWVGKIRIGNVCLFIEHMDGSYR